MYDEVATVTLCQVLIVEIKGSKRIVTYKSFTLIALILPRALLKGDDLD